MPCPSCDHTMHGLGNGCFWCPRCGTLKNERTHTPMLVTRCRKFEETLGPSWQALWHRLEIKESINPPKGRLVAELRDAWQGSGRGTVDTFMEWVQDMAEDERGTLQEAAKALLADDALVATLCDRCGKALEPGPVGPDGRTHYYQCDCMN